MEKQDTGFQKELMAYERTRDVWGKLVPKPYFISESPSGGVMLLGLQLGRRMTDSEREDPDIRKRSNLILRFLRKKYGIQHNDPAPRNAIMLEIEEGHDQVVIIDFENWDDVQ